MFGREWLNANVSYCLMEAGRIIIYVVLARNAGRCASSPADQSGSDEMTVKCTQ